MLRVDSLGIRQIRTPVKAPKANAIAERWIRTVRAECLDHVFVFVHRHLQILLNEYTAYYNRWRPHRSLGQRATRDLSVERGEDVFRPGALAKGVGLEGPLHFACFVD